jgi:hypothetical protein
MKWVTREKAHVDRIACPWLIKKFVDPQAELLFVPADKVLEVAKREGAISYDAKGADLTHVGEECSFDAIIHKYNLTDPTLLELAKVVRGADTANKNLTPQSPGLNSIADGFRLITKDDFDNMAKQFFVYDALYAFFKEQAARKQ